MAPYAIYAVALLISSMVRGTRVVTDGGLKKLGDSVAVNNGGGATVLVRKVGGIANPLLEDDGLISENMLRSFRAIDSTICSCSRWLPRT